EAVDGTADPGLVPDGGGLRPRGLDVGPVLLLRGQPVGGPEGAPVDPGPDAGDLARGERPPLERHLRLDRADEALHQDARVALPRDDDRTGQTALERGRPRVQAERVALQVEPVAARAAGL